MRTVSLLWVGGGICFDAAGDMFLPATCQLVYLNTLSKINQAQHDLKHYFNAVCGSPTVTIIG